MFSQGRQSSGLSGGLGYQHKSRCMDYAAVIDADDSVNFNAADDTDFAGCGSDPSMATCFLIVAPTHQRRRPPHWRSQSIRQRLHASQHISQRQTFKTNLDLSAGIDIYEPAHCTPDCGGDTANGYTNHSELISDTRDQSGPRLQQRQGYSCGIRMRAPSVAL